jgi:hypothetical protein
MSIRTDLVKKWDAAEGKMSLASIQDEFVKENLAVLLENQSSTKVKDLVMESNNFSMSAPDSESTGQFKPIALALVRRTFPELFANKCVGVQAMNSPVGVAFALRMVYAGTNSGSAGAYNEAAFDKVDKFSGFTGSISGMSGTADTGTGTALATAEGWQMLPGAGNFPQLQLKLERVAIEALTRKLGASYSLEAAQDIKAMHNLDIDREMVNVLQYEIMAELDRELLYNMKTVAVDTSIGGTAVTSINVSASDGRWSQEKFSNVVNAIVAASNNIAITTRRGAGNFVVVSPRVATAIQSSGPQFTRNRANVNATGIVTDVGSINETITVYRDSYATSDYALVGYKGPGISDAGIIYSPYVMGLFSRAIEPQDFSPRVGVMSRYGITKTLLGAGRYYKLVNFSNLDLVLGM